MHIVFLEYSHQDFTVLYGSLGLSVIVGILFHKILFTRRVRPRWINVSIISMCCFMVLEYWIMNSNYAHAERKTTQNEIILKTNSTGNDAVLFLKNEKLSVIQTYYLKRNVMTISNDDMAKTFLHQHDIKKGIIVQEGQAVQLED